MSNFELIATEELKNHLFFEKERYARTITLGNLKGGVGKTTNAVLVAFQAAMQGIKTLLIDLDTSEDATDLIFTTMINVLDKEPNYETTLYKAMEENLPAKEVIIDVMDNLDFIPSNEDFQNYGKLLDDRCNSQKEKDFYLDNYLESIKSEYDLIILDVPPSINIYTDSALVTSDYVVVVLQTQRKAFRKSKKFIEYISKLRETYELGFVTLGVLEVLLKADSEYDEQVIYQAEEYFGQENIFNDQIKDMRRIKRFDWSGITSEKRDPHDNQVHRLYGRVLNDMLNRIYRLESEA
ncbi:AAA family ATPase [Enterococcus sp. 5H]|uniref:AAA family ATPase n=1 Tax=Enterococcus sp. 5H TaxID=1229490 RepID=UPI0023030030|nr:AAA family ATPase [Enterococcus sp. 5H]MDA9470590.1 replication-associated protein [Enterococcus sp. 5H]